MDSSDTLLPADFTLKRKSGSERKRYQALRQLNIPHADAIELSKKTFAELQQMGYKFKNPQRDGEKPVKQTSKTTKCSKRSRHDALKKIGVSFNLDELSKKSFAELKQMGFKFTQKPSEKPVNQSFKAVPKETLKETEIPQPPQQQGQFVQGIRVCIKNAIPMTDSQLETLSHAILEKIAGMPQGEGPRFKGYSHKPGWLLITCADQRSKDWLEELIPSFKPWPEAILEIIPESELPKPNTAVVFIPNTDTTMIKQSLSLIRAQNALQTELWKVLHSKAQKGGVILTLSLDRLSVENLQKKGLKANLGFHEVQFRLKGQKVHQSGTDSFSTMDQGLPGTFCSDPKLAPALKALAPAPFHPATDSPDTRKVFPVPPNDNYRDIESSSMGDKDTEYRAVTQLHQRYPSTGSHGSREDIRRGTDGGASYSGRDDFKGGASYSNREGIPRSTAVTSYNDRHGFEGVDSYCSDEDIREDFAWGTRYNERGASYSRREDVIRDARYSGIDDVRDRDNRGDIRGDSSSSYKNRDKEDIRRDMNRRASYIGREVIAKDADGGTSYISREDTRRDISGGIHYSDTGIIGGYQIQQQYPKRDILDDISEFREKRYLREERSRSPSSSGILRGRDNCAGTGDGQIHQHFPRSTGSYRDWVIVEDIGGINRGTNEFLGRSDSQIHRHFTPSTMSYRDRDIGEDIRRCNGDSSGFEGRKDTQIHQQFPPSSERDINFREDRGVNGGTSFGDRGYSQIYQSNWGNSSMKSMGGGSQGYTPGVMHGHTRGDTQRYTQGDNREFSTGDSQRYTRGDDNQSYNRKRDS